MIETCKNGVKSELELRVLQQAGRELLLSQSSDWSFILKAGTTTELAKERIHRHLKRFWLLINSFEKNTSGICINIPAPSPIVGSDPTAPLCVRFSNIFYILIRYL